MFKSVVLMLLKYLRQVNLYKEKRSMHLLVLEAEMKWCGVAPGRLSHQTEEQREEHMWEKGSYFKHESRDSYPFQ